METKKIALLYKKKKKLKIKKKSKIQEQEKKTRRKNMPSFVNLYFLNRWSALLEERLMKENWAKDCFFLLHDVKIKR